MADPIVWPTAVLPPQSIMFSRQTMSRSGGQSVSGVEQVVMSSADRWRAKLVTKITRMEQALAFRAMMAAADGRAGTWMVPTCSGFQRLGPSVKGVFPAIGVTTIVNAPFSDAATFDDTGTFETKTVMGIVSVPASIRSRSISVQMTTDVAQNPIAGHYFSIGQALYVIATSDPDPSETPGLYTLTFRPGLRVAAAQGDVVDFSRPACRMRLASDDSGELSLDQLRFATVSLDFVEDAQTT